MCRYLIVLIAGLACAQTPTQVDYNTQIRNKPTSYTATPGVDTLNAAVAATPSGGILVVPAGTYAMNVSVTISKTISISCQPGSVLLANANNLQMLVFSGAGQLITGCTVNGGTKTGVQGIRVLPGSSAFSATWNAFKGSNDGMLGMLGVNIGTIGSSPSNHPSVAGAYLAHNSYLSILDAITTYGISPLNIEYEYCTNLTGDCVYNNTFYQTFPQGAIFTVSHVTGDNLHRYGLEWAGVGYQWIDFGFNSFSGPGDAGSAGGPGISGGTDGGSDPATVDQLVGGSIHDNSVVGTAVIPGGGELYEIYGHDYSVYGNRAECTLCGGGFLYGTFRTIYRDNTLIGIGEDDGGNNGYGWAENPGFTIGNYSFHDNQFLQNNCINVEFVCVAAGADGDVISGNVDVRAPGYFSTDVTGGFAGHVAFSVAADSAGGRPILVSGNTAELTAPVNGFSLASPGLFSWKCLQPFGPAPIAFLSNKCTNQNATQFGSLLAGGSNTYFNNATLFGTISTNLTQIGQGVGGLSTSTLSYGANSSLIGLGSGSPVTDFTITKTYPSSLSIVTGAALMSGAVTFNGGAGSSGSPSVNVIAGTINKGTISITTSTSPNASQTVFSLTFPSGFFTAAPTVCVIQPQEGGGGGATTASAQVSYSQGLSSSTSVSFVAGTTALAGGTTYHFAWLCP